MGKLAKFDDSEFQSIVKQFANEAKGERVAKAIQLTAGKVSRASLKQVKSLTPVDTGNLKRRWRATINRQGDTTVIEIYNTAKYAAFVEEGHRIVRGGKTYGFKKGVHMLQSTTEKMEKEVIPEAERLMQEAIEKIFG
jgi:hypothetical protein